MKSPRRTLKISNGTSATTKYCNGCFQKLSLLISQTLAAHGETTRSCCLGINPLMKAPSPHLESARRPLENTGTSSCTTTSSAKKRRSPKPKWKQRSTGSHSPRASPMTRTRSRSSSSVRGGKQEQRIYTGGLWQHSHPKKPTSSPPLPFIPTALEREALLGMYDRRLNQILTLVSPSQFSLNGFLFPRLKRSADGKVSMLLAVTTSTTPSPQA